MSHSDVQPMYRILTETMCDGWVCTETDENGDEVHYATIEEAQAEIDELVLEMDYDPDEYRIEQV